MEILETELFNGQFITMLPVNLADMPEDYARQKYPLEGRPEIIKTDEDYTSDYKFSCISIGTRQYAVDYINQQAKKAVFDSCSSYKFIEDISVADEKNNIAKGFAFSNNVLDGTAYNAIIHKQFERQVMNISLSCPLEKSSLLLEYLISCVRYMRINNK